MKARELIPRLVRRGAPAVVLVPAAIDHPGSEEPSTLERQYNLVRELAITQFRLKYTGSVLGYVWSLAKPLMIFAIMYAVFSRLLRVGAGSPNFALQLLTAVVMWQFFAETTAVGLQSIVSNANVIRKAYFPRAILVIAATLTAFMTFLINFALILIVFVPLGRLAIGWETLWLLPLVVELYVVALGLSLLLSTLYVFFRDVGYIWEIGTQILFYGSAVVYPLAFVPGQLQRLIVLNPVAQIIEDVRHVVVTRQVASSGAVLGHYWFAPLLIALATTLLGYWAFMRWSPQFAENL